MANEASSNERYGIQIVVDTTQSVDAIDQLTNKLKALKPVSVSVAPKVNKTNATKLAAELRKHLTDSGALKNVVTINEINISDEAAKGLATKVREKINSTIGELKFNTDQLNEIIRQVNVERTGLEKDINRLEKLGFRVRNRTQKVEESQAAKATKVAPKEPPIPTTSINYGAISQLFSESWAQKIAEKALGKQMPVLKQRHQTDLFGGFAAAMSNGSIVKTQTGGIGVQLPSGKTKELITKAGELTEVGAKIAKYLAGGASQNSSYFHKDNGKGQLDEGKFAGNMERGLQEKFGKNIFSFAPVAIYPLLKTVSSTLSGLVAKFGPGMALGGVAGVSKFVGERLADPAGTKEFLNTVAATLQGMAAQYSARAQVNQEHATAARSASTFLRSDAVVGSGITNPTAKASALDTMASNEEEAGKWANVLSNVFSVMSNIASVAGVIFGVISKIVEVIKQAQKIFHDVVSVIQSVAKGVQDMVSKLETAIGNVWKRVKQLIGIGQQGIFRSALTEAKQLDAEYQKTINTLKGMIGQVIKPISTALVTILQQIMIYINAFVKALTGKDLLAGALKRAKAISGHAAKTRKQLSLASFDTILNVGKTKTSGGGGTGSFAGYLDPSDYPEVSPVLLDYITKLGEILKPVWDLLKEIFTGVDEFGKDMSVITFLSNVIQAIEMLNGVLLVSNLLTGNFGGALMNLAAILGGSFLVSSMEDYAKHNGDMSETQGKVNEYVEKARQIFGKFKDKFTEVTEKVHKFLNTFDMKPIIGAVANLASGVGELGEHVTDTEFLTNGFTSVLNKPFYSALRVVGNTLGKVVDNLDAYDENGDQAISITELLNALFDNLDEILSGIWKTIGEVVSGAIKGIRSTLKGFANLVNGFLAAAAALSAVAGLVLLASGNIPLGIALLGGGPGIMAGAAAGFNNMMNKIIGALDTVGAAVDSIFSTNSFSGGGIANAGTGQGAVIDPKAIAANERIGKEFEAMADDIAEMNEKGMNLKEKTIDQIEPVPVNKVENAFRSAMKSSKFKADGIIKNAVNIKGNETLWHNTHGFTINYAYAAKGTNLVPEDQLAMIHKGEAIIPKAFNTSEFFKNMGTSDEVTKELKEIHKDINKLKLSVNLDGKAIADNTVKHINEETRLQGRSVLV